MMFSMKTVFVAMSGGIDSSYAAYLLTGMGHKVVGCTFALLPGGMTNPKNPKACCSAETIGRARQVADRLGISSTAWRRWETGEHLPSEDLLHAIEDLTGMPLYVLFCPHLETCPLAMTGQSPTANGPCCQCAFPPPGTDNGS